MTEVGVEEVGVEEVVDVEAVAEEEVPHTIATSLFLLILCNDRQSSYGP